MSRTGCILALIAVAAACAAAGERDDWYMFRGGPALLGRARGTLSERLRLRWRFKTKEAIRSSAAIVGDRVYVGSDDGHVYALKLSDGSKVWAHKTGDTVEASPLVLEGTVYVGSGDGFLYALDAATGKRKWAVKTEDRILGSANWMRGADGTLRIVVGSYDSKLYCVDAATGKVAWAYQTENYVNGAPGLADGRIAFGGCDAQVHVLSAADGTKLHSVEAGAYIAASVAIDGHMAFVGHYGNELLCVDVAAGKVVWRYKDKEEAFFSSAAVTADRVLIGSRDKRLHCVDRRTGKRQWAFKTRGEVDSSPVVAGDKVVFGSNGGRLYLVTLADGKELWTFEIGEAVTTSPAVARGLVVVGADDGGGYAFGPWD